MQKRIQPLSLINQFILLAEYNQLMNQRQYNAVANLSSENQSKDTGAFFKSILGTLNHIIIGDIIWLKRFAKHPSNAEPLSYFLTLDNPKSLSSSLFEDFNSLSVERKKIDTLIIDWIKNLEDKDVNNCIKYNNMAGTAFNKPQASLINHLFLHQVHHRGQVSTLLSQFNVDFGETDIIEIIGECNA